MGHLFTAHFTSDHRAFVSFVLTMNRKRSDISDGTSDISRTTTDTQSKLCNLVISLLKVRCQIDADLILNLDRFKKINDISVNLYAAYSLVPNISVVCAKSRRRCDVKAHVQ